MHTALPCAAVPPCEWICCAENRACRVETRGWTHEGGDIPSFVVKAHGKHPILWIRAVCMSPAEMTDKKIKEYI